MVPITPPPLPPGHAEDATVPRSPTRRELHLAEAERVGPGRLIGSWRWVVGLGWLFVLITLLAVGGGSQRLGKPTWWIDQPLAAVMPVAPVVYAIIQAARNSRWALPVGWVAAVVLAVTAALDRGPSPGAALVEAGLAVAGAAVSVACLAGRVRPARPLTS